MFFFNFNNFNVKLKPQKFHIISCQCPRAIYDTRIDMLNILVKSSFKIVDLALHPMYLVCVH